MALRKGQKIELGYATVTQDEGDTYRDIATVMTAMGHPMNHSSARNHVLRIMKRFAAAFMESQGLPRDEEQVTAAARSPMFQSGVMELLQRLEQRRRDEDASSSVPC